MLIIEEVTQIIALGAASIAIGIEAVLLAYIAKMGLAIVREKIKKRKG